MTIASDPDLFEPLVAAGIVELTARFQAGSATPVDSLHVYLSRIQRLNPVLNAFLVVDNERALDAASASAARWAAGAPLSRLDGLPVGVKANIAVEGLPWHGGVGAYRDRIAERDAEVVATLRRSGAVIVGLLNMHEAALGATSDNVAFGRCHNPYRRDVTPGGSSGGSAAAVAAGLCAAALGTDTLGSVRIPSAFCGVFGHKPAPGQISVASVMPLSKSWDTVGFHVRSARDGEALLSVLTARPMPPHEPKLSTLTCGILDLAGRIALHRDTVAAFERTVAAVAAAGLRIQRIEMPDHDVAAVRRDAMLVVAIDALNEHAAALERTPQAFSEALKSVLRWADRQPRITQQAAHDHLSMAAATLKQRFEPFDMILTPTTPGPAFAVGQPSPANIADFTLLANLTGLAATAFPVGMGSEALPLSNQIMSRDGALALRLAGRFSTSPPPPPRA
jgi:aspartyl-tRNA(Asn)/glutamyl-tRNA(Gln) amidotransferase subunit A